MVRTGSYRGNDPWWCHRGVVSVPGVDLRNRAVAGMVTLPLAGRGFYMNGVEMKTRKQVEKFYKTELIPIIDQLWELCDKHGMSMLVNISTPLSGVKACCYISQCNVEKDETPLGMILAVGCAQERFDEVAAMLGRLKKTAVPGFVPGPLD